MPAKTSCPFPFPFPFPAWPECRAVSSSFVGHLHVTFVGAADLVPLVGGEVEYEAVTAARFGDRYGTGRDESVEGLEIVVPLLAVGADGKHRIHEFGLVACGVGTRRADVETL